METSQIAEPRPVEDIDGIKVGPLLVGDEMSCQSFQIEAGGKADTHSHPHEQIIFVLSGTLSFRVNNTTIDVGPDEVILLEGNEPHSVVNRGDRKASGLEVFSPPRPEVSEWLGE